MLYVVNQASVGEVFGKVNTKGPFSTDFLDYPFKPDDIMFSKCGVYGLRKCQILIQ